MAEHVDVQLLVKRNSLHSLERRLDNDLITIGRSSENDITCDNPLVSSKHGSIFYNQALQYSDYSRNGTYHLRDGVRTYVHNERITLHERDILLIGDMQIILAKVTISERSP